MNFRSFSIHQNCRQQLLSVNSTVEILPQRNHDHLSCKDCCINTNVLTYLFKNRFCTQEWANLCNGWPRMLRPTQPFIPPGSVNEYQLRLGKQRQVWFIPLAYACRVCRWNWDPMRTRAIPEHLRGVIMTRRCTNPRLRLPYLMSAIAEVHISSCKTK